MLHLAQVNKTLISGEIELQLLAYQSSVDLWEVTHSRGYCIVVKNEDFLKEGVLVLVELGEDKQILKIENAKEWVLTVIKTYLNGDMLTPELVEKEQARIEQWRQEITVQSLDLTRRHLELETRRDQLQELETSLKEEKEKLETRWQYLHELQEEIQKEKEESKNL